MQPHTHLMIPGPTPLPEEVRAAMNQPGIGHRSPEFKAVLERVFPALQWAFQTKNDVFLLTASGTGAMEAAMMNTLNPDDKALVLCCGVFSSRWATMAESMGAEVTRLTVEPGDVNTDDALKAHLETVPANTYKMIVATHSETSTGVLNPIEKMIPLIKNHGALSVVDAVTSLGSAPIPVDDWGIDMVISGSQKGFMIPPGLSFLSVSEKAWEARKAVKHPGFYWDFNQYKKAQDQSNTPYTPATHTILALDAALKMMQAEGLDEGQQRHLKLRNMVRAGCKALGLELLVKDDEYASWAVTSVLPPASVSVPEIRSGLKAQGIVVANGQKDLKDKIFRIGHLGFQFERDVLMTLTALENVLSEKGHSITKGAATEAAQQAIKAIQPVACAV